MKNEITIDEKLSYNVIMYAFPAYHNVVTGS